MHLHHFVSFRVFSGHIYFRCLENMFPRLGTCCRCREVEPEFSREAASVRLSRMRFLCLWKPGRFDRKDAKKSASRRVSSAWKDVFQSVGEVFGGMTGFSNGWNYFFPPLEVRFNDLNLQRFQRGAARRPGSSSVDSSSMLIGYENRFGVKLRAIPRSENERWRTFFGEDMTCERGCTCYGEE